jgi:hypothetical protein
MSPDEGGDPACWLHLFDDPDDPAPDHGPGDPAPDPDPDTAPDPDLAADPDPGGG